MGRKEYFRQGQAYKRNRNRAYIRAGMPSRICARETYGRSRAKKSMEARRSFAVNKGARPGASIRGADRPQPFRLKGYGTGIQKGYRPGNACCRGNLRAGRIRDVKNPAAEREDIFSFRESQDRKGTLHVKLLGISPAGPLEKAAFGGDDRAKAPLSGAFPTKRKETAKRQAGLLQAETPRASHSGQGPYDTGTGTAGPNGGGDSSREAEELKRKLHVKFPQERGAGFIRYAERSLVKESAIKKRKKAREKTKEYYIKRKEKEVKKRRMGFSRQRPRGYSQYLKEFKKEGKRKRKDAYKGRRDAARAQMKEAFKKSAVLHFSKTLGAAAGSFEEDMQRNPMGFFTSFASGALKYAGKQILNILAYAFSGVMSALFPLILLLLPFLLIFLFLMSLFTTSVSTPELYFNGGFTDGELKAQGDFIDNALKGHYDALDTQIKNFKAADAKNTVVYANGFRYNKNSVLAVYFSILCTRDDYDGLYQKKNEPYPPYLFADTEKEKSLLKEIFSQMNYVKETQVSYLVVTGIDPGTNTPITETRTYKKLTVYNLTISQWLSEHPSGLSKKAKGMLELLKKYENMAYSGGGGYTPLGDISMPAGADANLVYMAATLKAEAVGEPEEGQIAVGYVIFNRAGGNIGGVLGACLAPGQFSCWGDGSAQRYLAEYSGMSLEQMNTDQCYRVCVAVTSGQTGNPIGTKKYYCNPKTCTAGYEAQMAKIRAHNSPDEIQVIGQHVFCENYWH